MLTNVNMFRHTPLKPQGFHLELKIIFTMAKNNAEKKTLRVGYRIIFGKCKTGNGGRNGGILISKLSP